MSLEEKVGQLLMPTYKRDSVDGNIVTLINHYYIGGVFLSLDSLEQKKKIKKLTEDLQSYASNEKPLFIGSNVVNDELTNIDDLVAMPRESILYKLNNRLYTKQLAEVIGQQLRELGINVYSYPNLHIVNDENLYNKVDLLANHGVAIVEGLQQSDVISLISGFPSTEEVNPNLGPDRRASNLYPFYKVIHKGAKAIALTEPSKKSIDHYLRTRMQYDQIIAYELSEDFAANELISDYIIDLINNGVNLLTLPFSFSKLIEVLNIVFKRANLGDIDVAILDKSVHKLMQIKAAYQLNAQELLGRPLTEHQITSVKEKVVKKHLQQT